MKVPIFTGRKSTGPNMISAILFTNSVTHEKKCIGSSTLYINFLVIILK